MAQLKRLADCAALQSCVTPTTADGFYTRRKESKPQTLSTTNCSLVHCKSGRVAENGTSTMTLENSRTSRQQGRTANQGRADQSCCSHPSREQLKRLAECEMYLSRVTQFLCTFHGADTLIPGNVWSATTGGSPLPGFLGGQNMYKVYDMTTSAKTWADQGRGCKRALIGSW